MKTECLDFRTLPVKNSLFLDFACDFEKVRNFYHHPPVSEQWIHQRVERVLKTSRFPRSRLLPALETLNRAAGTHEKIIQNLEKFASSDTVAVVTGQQVGLFGGPAFAVYKAATAVRLALWLEELGYQAVPIFWLASDDSDFDEVRTTHFSGERSQPVAVSYPYGRLAAGRMAGTVELKGIETCLKAFQKNCRNLKTSFVKPTADLLQRSYQPGRSFREAFGSWLRHLFGAYGLILFDPLVPTHRAHLGDFYARVVENRKQIVEDLTGRGAALQSQGFASQVKLDPSESLLFWLNGQSRNKVRFEEGLFQAKGPDRLSLEQSEFRNLIEKEPQRVGTSALLRPVLQDYLFPTVTYVGGPAEVAYFAQITSYSRRLGLEMSIHPRSSFTLVDRKSQRLFRKYGLSLEELLSRSRVELVEGILREGDSAGILEKFDALRTDLTAGLEELGAQVGELDVPVADMLGNSGRKMLYHVDRVRRRFIRNREVTSGHLRDHLEHLYGRLLPLGKLQERVLNFNQFLAEEGPGLIDRIVDRSGPERVGHRVVYF